MSFAIDVNLLLYASDTESPLHERARDFLQSCMRQGELFCLAWPTLMGYLRIATHPAVFARPLTPAEAAANVGVLLGCRMCDVWPRRKASGTFIVA